MVKTLKKMLICICIIMVLLNFTLEIPSLAKTASEIVESAKITYDNTAGFSIGDRLLNSLSGIAGVLITIPKLAAAAVATIIQSISVGIARMAGAAPDAKTGMTLSPDDILFNKINLTSIDFFNTSGLDDGNIIKEIREQIALWYYIMRTIAIVILLGILIFVGIRMAITTVASDKAIYKKALFDWFTSLALVFLLHYIIRAVIWINDSLVQVLVNISDDANLNELITALKIMIFDVDFCVGLGATIIYIILTVESLMFLVSYIKRMLVLAFLIIISPLITITYSIDKMGDQKAQALNTWLKEFSYNVLIQPFHCILYIVFVTIAVKAVNNIGSFGSMVLAILCIKFVWDGEKIVRKIFGFESASSLVSLAASSAIVGGAINKAVSAGKATATGVKYAKNTKTGQLIKQKWSDSKETRGLNKQAKKEYRAAKKDNDLDKMNDIKNNKDNRSVFKKAADTANTPIRKMKGATNKAKKAVGGKAKKITGFAKGTKLGQKISEKAKDLGIPELGKAIGADAKRFTRSLLQPEKLAKVSAGILAGAALYALPDSNVVTAVAGGYGAGKTLENKVREMRNRKNENYEEDVLKAWESHCNANPRVDRNDKSAFETWMKQNEAEGKLKMYSDKNISKKEDKAREDLTEQKSKFGLSDNDIEAILASIRLTLAKGEVYDPSELFKDYTNANVSAEDINKIVGGFAAIYNNSIIFEKTDAFDTQMEQFGYDHEDVVNDMDVSKLQSDPSRQYDSFVAKDVENIITSKPTIDVSEIERELETVVSNRIDETVENLRTIIEPLNSRGVNFDHIVSELESDIQNVANDSVNKLENTIERTLKGLGINNVPKSDVQTIREQLVIHRDTIREQEIITNNSKLVIEQINERKNR